MDIVNSILTKIRHQTQWINDVNVGNPDIVEMYQPFFSDQYEIVEALWKSGVYLDVIVSPGVLIEGDPECDLGFQNDSVTAKTSFFETGNIFNELKDNKSIFFYFWAILPDGMTKLRYVKSSKIIRPLQRYRKE
jgi:hypothetical protein